MSDTIREQIISAIETKLADITVANGYNTDIGKEVLRARKNVDPDSLPAVVIWPLPEIVERKSGKYICTMRTRLEGLMKFEENNPSVISEQILGDLIALMADPAKRSTLTAGLADDVFYSEGGTDDYPEEKDISVGASAIFAVIYKIKIGNPYSQ